MRSIDEVRLSTPKGGNGEEDREEQGTISTSGESTGLSTPISGNGEHLGSNSGESTSTVRRSKRKKSLTEKAKENQAQK